MDLVEKLRALQINHKEISAVEKLEVLSGTGKPIILVTLSKYTGESPHTYMKRLGILPQRPNINQYNIDIKKNEKVYSSGFDLTLEDYIISFRYKSGIPR